MPKKLYKQQLQTQKFFELDAVNWKKKSNSKKTNLHNTILERNFYVASRAKHLKIKSLIDVGCGTGDLCFDVAKFTKNCVGIDFSDNMIKIAKKNFIRKNLFFLRENFFNYKNKKKFDCLSANGFIEYLSINDIKRFFVKSRELVNNNGYLIFGTRNRLFNLFSLNKFSLKELKEKTFKKFYEESIALTQMNFKSFIKLKKNKFNEVLFQQPKTGINVDKRHQFSPIQICEILKRTKWKVIEFYPINYHPTVPSNYNFDQKSKKFSKLIYLSKDQNKLPYIPFASSFMVLAKKL